MTRKNKQELIRQVVTLLNALIEVDEENTAPKTKEPTEMLTIKECAETVKGISEHTIRKLVAQNRIRYIRTGEGERGKILISKKSLLDYIEGAA